MVLDTEGVRHHKHKGDLLSRARHAWIARNHLRNISLDAFGFLGVSNDEIMYLINTISDIDILEIDLETINGLPFTIF